MTPKDGSFTVVTDGLSVDLRPQWNVDAGSIVFERRTPGGSALHLARRRSSGWVSEPLVACNAGARRVQGRAAFFAQDDFAFVSDRSGQPAIWRAELAGGLVEPLTQPAADEADYGPTTAPNADGHFAFFRIIGSGKPHLFVGRLGETVQPLTTAANAGDQPWLVPSLDGLVFHSRRDGNDAVYFQHAAAGALAMRLSVGREGTALVTPFPSPDGRRVVFASAVAGTSQLWTMRIDGSARRQLTFGHTPACFPAWSPAGDEIVYVRGDPQAESPSGQIVVMAIAELVS